MARVAARRKEIQAAEARRPQNAGTVGGDIREFTNTCRLCGASFTYRGIAIVFGTGQVRPAFAPQRVCERVACIATAARERDEADAAASQQERRERIDAAHRMFVERVPPQYHARAAIEPACEAHIVDALKPWTPAMSAYVHGPSGHGKSHQVACLMRRAVLDGREITWVSTRRLVQDAMSAIGKKSERPAIVSKPCAGGVLVLNDVFAETATQFAVTLIGDIVDARYEAGLPIVFTSNVAPSQITRTVNASRADAATVTTELERIRGRILEMTAPGRGILYRHEDRDWRAALATGDVEARPRG